MVLFLLKHIGFSGLRKMEGYKKYLDESCRVYQFCNFAEKNGRK